MLKKLSSLLLIVFILSSFGEHKFYVSIGELRHKPEKNRLEIALKVFTDDLEKAIQKNHTDFKIGTQTDLDKNAQQLNTYFLKHFTTSANTGPWEIIGYELNYDVVWIYMESTFLSKDSTEFTLTNTILMDVYPEQVNIINFTNSEGNINSYLFQQNQRSHQIPLSL